TSETPAKGSDSAFLRPGACRFGSRSRRVPRTGSASADASSSARGSCPIPCYHRVVHERRWSVAGLVVLGLGALHGTDVRAHFRLVSPEAATVQNAVGDPQKAPPCGGGTDFTGAVTAFRPGETITITIDETVFHPGHYRVVLAVDDP